MGAKRYELIRPERIGTVPADFDKICKNALLLALLQQNLITRWQYEQVCGKLGLTYADDLVRLR